MGQIKRGRREVCLLTLTLVDRCCFVARNGLETFLNNSQGLRRVPAEIALFSSNLTDQSGSLGMVDIVAESEVEVIVLEILGSNL